MTKSIAILEHSEHWPRLKESIGPDTTVLVWTPYAAYELERNKVNFKVPADYLNHPEFFGIYQECTSRLLDILISLDEDLWQIDPRFKTLGIKPFFLGAYQFKLPLDEILVLICQLNRVIRQELPDEIIIVSTQGFKPAKAEQSYFHPYDAVCRELLSKFSRVYNFKLKIIEASRTFAKNSLTEMIKRSDWFQKLRLLKNNYREIADRPRTGDASKARVLSVDCRDLNFAAPALSEHGYTIERFSQLDFALAVRPKRYVHTKQLLERFDADEKIRDLCCFEGVEFYELLRTRIETYVQALEDYLTRHQWLDQYVAKRKYDLVMLNSLSPYEPAGTMLADICQKRKIPHACWMHGGFGANQTFEGYDVTDLMLGQYYLTYGDAVNRTIEGYFLDSVLGRPNVNRINGHYPKKNLTCVTGGTPWMEGQFEGYVRPVNEKKVILFIMGELWIHNQYYMGANTPNTYFQKWDQIKAIVRTLIPFQDKYEVILKTYPTDQLGFELLKRFLEDQGGHSIQVVKNEQSIEDLLKRCDLTVSTWVSTTFFQAAFTDSDQFLLDDSDLTPEARTILGHTCYFSSQLDEFCQSLSEYLHRGAFYQKSKREFCSKYLDQDHRENRAEHIDQCLQKILRKTPAAVS